MRISSTPLVPVGAPTAIQPGALLGRGVVSVSAGPNSDERTDVLVDVTAGKVLLTGVTDVQDAAQNLIRAGWNGGDRGTHGLVAFVRNADAWDAVEMLAPTRIDGGGIEQLWSPTRIGGFRAMPFIGLDAIWQISDYGFDTRYGTSGSMFPLR